ncbi:MAG: hypothetical protein J5I52_11265 [Saprospiraceae bacterium]|nr:MAG: hypothetical protein UZ09_BCD002000953 [Bacteroidetes bacterium OLB9]MCO6464714.1 hypothetical protein [Saprospiraceae bacterium]MCZ2337562.1 hypothetical protein [Chitinophagales bacterium]
MKPLTLFRAFMAFAVMSLFLVSCGEDTDILDTSVAPTVKLNESLGYITEDSEVLVGGNFSVYLTGTKGSNPMKTLTILEDGKAIDITSNRIAIDGNLAPANPLLLLQDKVNSFEYKISIAAHGFFGTEKYEFVVADEKGLTSKVALNITVVGQDVNSLEGILLNQSGPAGQGGLDLDTGASTGTQDSDPTSAEAEIRDEGIVDILTDQTWKQQISGMNGAVMKYIKPGQNGVAENFTFDNILYKEQISAMWNNGVDFNLKSEDGKRDVSDKVNKGDIFIVKKGEKYYVISTRQINITNDNNQDNYVFDVKF